MTTRKPAVAGRFYPGTAGEITALLKRSFETERKNINLPLARHQIIGAIVPHAGYVFSSYEAIHFFEILRKSRQRFDTFVIINPNHTGYGPEIALDGHTFWETPYGPVEVDTEMIAQLPFSIANIAHQYEHSGEVMVPMLQYSVSTPFRILPITLTRQSEENAGILAREIFRVAQSLRRKICMIASSDFSHYVNPQEGEMLDRMVIENIIRLDAKRVYQTVVKNNISVCGYGPIMTLIHYSTMLTGYPQAQILRRGHSGEVVPSDEVVDYVCILFYLAQQPTDIK
ncbi:MAG: AmmeMemoRadiSam system protein B [Bacteroidales bacterium]|nr:AmmeMemoRadiSam system protein B [Bacteroidales bacterium]